MVQYTFTTDDSSLAAKIAELIKGHTTEPTEHPLVRLKKQVMEVYHKLDNDGHPQKIRAIRTLRDLCETYEFREMFRQFRYMRDGVSKIDLAFAKETVEAWANE